MPVLYIRHWPVVESLLGVVLMAHELVTVNDPGEKSLIAVQTDLVTFLCALISGLQGTLACSCALWTMANVSSFIGVLKQGIPPIFRHPNLRQITTVRLYNAKSGFAPPLDAVPSLSSPPPASCCQGGCSGHILAVVFGTKAAVVGMDHVLRIMHYKEL
jgi:hypothetical protein